MKHQISLGNILSLITFYSAIALIAAYVSQYVFGLQPCILCLYQRVPFWLIIGFNISLVAFSKKVRGSLMMKKLVFFISILLLLINCGIAFYHTLVERKIVVGFDKCSSIGVEANNVADLEKALNATKAVRCDEPQFMFLGLSMASWNFVYCLMIVVMSLALYKRIKE